MCGLTFLQLAQVVDRDNETNIVSIQFRHEAIEISGTIVTVFPFDSAAMPTSGGRMKQNITVGIMQITQIS